MNVPEEGQIKEHRVCGQLVKAVCGEKTERPRSMSPLSPHEQRFFSCDSPETVRQNFFVGVPTANTTRSNVPAPTTSAEPQLGWLTCCEQRAPGHHCENDLFISIHKA